jgi:pimeloyl-ACP methyl ester carboxylesterase
VNVLLIHGLGRTPLSMWGLAHCLRSHTYKPHFFGYWAWKNSYAEIVAELRSHLSQLASQGDYAIVAHSLGGVLCRSALKDWPFAMPSQVVMLGPPNQVPRLAPRVSTVPLFRWVTQDCGQNLSDPNFYANLPMLPCPYTIIAGTVGPRGNMSPFGNEINDGIVALNETLMQAGDRPFSFPVFHTFMMNDPHVQNLIIQQLKAINHP